MPASHPPTPEPRQYFPKVQYRFFVPKSKVTSVCKALIAVVDDEEPIRKALQRLLRSAGFETVAFASGLEFLESLATVRPQCLVLDLHMPDMTGFQLLERLADTDKQIPVLILTGHDSDEIRDKALIWRPAAYLRKPVHDQTLLDALELALSQ